MSNSEMALLVGQMWDAEYQLMRGQWHRESLREQWSSAFEELNKFFSPLEIRKMVWEYEQ